MTNQANCKYDNDTYITMHGVIALDRYDRSRYHWDPKLKKVVYTRVNKNATKENAGNAETGKSDKKIATSNTKVEVPSFTYSWTDANNNRYYNTGFEKDGVKYGAFFILNSNERAITRYAVEKQTDEGWKIIYNNERGKETENAKGYANINKAVYNQVKVYADKHL